MEQNQGHEQSTKFKVVRFKQIKFYSEKGKIGILKENQEISRNFFAWMTLYSIRIGPYLVEYKQQIIVAEMSP